MKRLLLFFVLLGSLSALAGNVTIFYRDETSSDGRGSYPVSGYSKTWADGVWGSKSASFQSSMFSTNVAYGYLNGSITNTWEGVTRTGWWMVNSTHGARFVVNNVTYEFINPNSEPVTVYFLGNGSADLFIKPEPPPVITSVVYKVRSQYITMGGHYEDFYASVTIYGFNGNVLDQAGAVVPSCPKGTAQIGPLNLSYGPFPKPVDSDIQPSGVAGLLAKSSSLSAPALASFQGSFVYSAAESTDLLEVYIATGELSVTDVDVPPYTPPVPDPDPEPIPEDPTLPPDPPGVNPPSPTPVPTPPPSEGIGDNMGWLGEVIGRLVEGIRTDLVSIYKGTVKAIQSGFDSLKTALTTASGVVVENVQAVGTALNNLAEQLGNEISEGFHNMNEALEGLGGKVDSIGNKLDELNGEGVEVPPDSNVLNLPPVEEGEPTLNDHNSVLNSVKESFSPLITSLEGLQSTVDGRSLVFGSVASISVPFGDMGDALVPIDYPAVALFRAVVLALFSLRTAYSLIKKFHSSVRSFPI